MDESWRISMGSVAPRRRSTEQHRLPRRIGDLNPDDFRDVFGGPPRTVLLRRFSGDLSPAPAASLYDEIFRPGEYGFQISRAGRSLPAFRIPMARGGGGVLRTEEGFYDDIFGSGGGDRRSRSRSKSKSKSRSTSSSVLSSEDVSPPLRRPIGDDAVLSSFASKLRPITIPTRRQNSSPPSTVSVGEQSSFPTLSIPCPPRPCFTDSQDRSKSSTKSHIGFSCCFSPAESNSLDPSSLYDTIAYNHLQHDDHCSHSDSDSPSSVISSVFPDHTAIRPTCYQDWNRPEFERENVVVEVEDGEAAESSYFIELDNRTTTGFRDAAGDAAVDEAIAWAKETFRSHQGSKEDDDDDHLRRIDSKDTNEDMDSSSRWVS